MQPLWLPPSTKVVPQFSRCSELPTAGFKNVLMNTGYGFFPLCLVPHPGLCCLVSIQFDKEGFCSLRRKAVDCKGQSGTRPKNSIWNLSILVTFLKRFKSKPFSALFCPSSFRSRGRGSNKGHSFGSLALQLKRGISRASKTLE